MTTAAPPGPEAPPRTTPRGTPCASSWDDAWVAQVAAREQAMDRRICGARNVGGVPCTLPSDHASGRCRHHGGFPLTGAPEDNRNAVVHGLYSRRLMICGSHCPAWQSCPMGGGSSFSADDELPGTDAKPRPTFKQNPDGSTEYFAKGVRIFNPPPGSADLGGMGFQPMQGEPGAPIPDQRNENDVDAVRETDAAGRTGWKPVPPKSGPPLSYAQQLLKLPLSERPQCSYELAEYNAAVTDVMKRTHAVADNSMGLHLAHHVALLTVMVSRAARALATKPFTEKMEQSAENYYMSVDKPSAALVAFEKLSRELRRWIHLVEREYQTFTADRAITHEHELRQQCDTRPDPDHAAALNLTASIAQKETARATTDRHSSLLAMDKQIMDTLLARFGAKGKSPSTTEDAEIAEEVKPKETENKNPGGTHSRASGVG